MYSLSLCYTCIVSLFLHSSPLVLMLPVHVVHTLLATFFVSVVLSVNVKLSIVKHNNGVLMLGGHTHTHTVSRDSFFSSELLCSHLNH